jgi:tetratricopeptide (TPR) repeat protein
MFFVGVSVFGQGAKFYLELAVDDIQKDDLDKALYNLDKSIEFDSVNFVPYYYRGVVKSMLHLPEDALPDLEKVIKLKPDFPGAYLNRGIVRKCLTDYEGAISDYSYAIKLDSNFAPAYYNRAMVYELLSKRDTALLDYKKSLELGLDIAKQKVDGYNENANLENIYPILRLTKYSDDSKYGFSSKFPIKVGRGPNGGPANQRAYLDLLRDKMGKPIKYRRVGSAGYYKSPNGLIGGSAVIDLYEITYLNARGKEKKANVYISFYDYEEPLILKGFGTVGNIKK